MQDNIPDALIAAFERHYDCSWDTPALRNERLAWRAAWAEATKPCLHQIAEPQTAPAAVAVPELQDMLRELRVQISAITVQLPQSVDCNGVWMAHDKMSAALAATPAAAPAALTTPQPFGYVVTTPAGVELFYRHPADLAIHNDHRAETVYTLPAVLAAAPVVQPEPVDAEKETQAVMQLVADYTRKAVLESSGNYPEITLAQMNEAWSAIFGKVRALLAQAATAAGSAAQAVEQVPVLYVSKEQLDHHRDPDGPGSANAGRYLPARKTPAGKLTTPLFAAADALDDSALLDAMERQRIAVVPEYEGPWDAEVYNGDEKPNHHGTGSTPREAIRAAIAAAKGE